MRAVDTCGFRLYLVRGLRGFFGRRRCLRKHARSARRDNANRRPRSSSSSLLFTPVTAPALSLRTVRSGSPGISQAKYKRSAFSSIGVQAGSAARVARPAGTTSTQARQNVLHARGTVFSPAIQALANGVRPPSSAEDRGHKWSIVPRRHREELFARQSRRLDQVRPRIGASCFARSAFPAAAPPHNRAAAQGHAGPQSLRRRCDVKKTGRIPEPKYKRLPASSRRA